jgi:hypothetical protein
MLAVAPARRSLSCGKHVPMPRHNSFRSLPLVPFSGIPQVSSAATAIPTIAGNLVPGRRWPSWDPPGGCDRLVSPGGDKESRHPLVQSGTETGRRMAALPSPHRSAISEGLHHMRRTRAISSKPKFPPRWRTPVSLLYRHGPYQVESPPSCSDRLVHPGKSSRAQNLPAFPVFWRVQTA